MTADNGPGVAASSPLEAERQTADLRDGETPDRASHAHQHDLVKADLKAGQFTDLRESDQALLELLAAVGEIPRSRVKTLFGEETQYSSETASTAGTRLKKRGLIEHNHRDPFNPNKHAWALTQVGREWVRRYGSDTDEDDGGDA